MRKSVFADQKWYQDMQEGYRVQQERDRQRELSRARRDVQTVEGAAHEPSDAVGDLTAIEQQRDPEESEAQLSEEDVLASHTLNGPPNRSHGTSAAIIGPTDAVVDSSPGAGETLGGLASHQAVAKPRDQQDAAFSQEALPRVTYNPPSETNKVEHNRAFSHDDIDDSDTAMNMLGSDEEAALKWAMELSLKDSAAESSDDDSSNATILVSDPNHDGDALPSSHFVPANEPRAFGEVNGQRLLAIVNGAEFSYEEREALELEAALKLSKKSAEYEESRREKSATGVQTPATGSFSTGQAQRPLPLHPETYRQQKLKIEELQRAYEKVHNQNIVLKSIDPATSRSNHQVQITQKLQKRLERLTDENEDLKQVNQYYKRLDEINRQLLAANQHRQHTQHLQQQMDLLTQENYHLHHLNAALHAQVNPNGHLSQQTHAADLQHSTASHNTSHGPSTTIQQITHALHPPQRDLIQATLVQTSFLPPDTPLRQIPLSYNPHAFLNQRRRNSAAAEPLYAQRGRRDVNDDGGSDGGIAIGERGGGGGDGVYAKLENGNGDGNGMENGNDVKSRDQDHDADSNL
ncbi:hypothetical protein J1614_011949 [Plenodomus biglobosus]|nr:hypothetical protein J1614_011949 [Plenodomus biglobosus]